MNDKIKVSKEDAAWYRKWEKRMASGNPKEGDYNFVVYRSGEENVYVPPTNGAEPSIFLNGAWKLVSELYEESMTQDQTESE